MSIIEKEIEGSEPFINENIQKKEEETRPNQPIEVDDEVSDIEEKDEEDTAEPVKGTLKPNNITPKHTTNREKGTKAFKDTIHQYLMKRAGEDPLFAVKFINPKKKLEDCITYVLNTVQKSGMQGFTDDEVTKAKNLSLDFFEHIYKNSPDGFVKDFDREKGQVTLKYLAIHADTSKANVMNYINKSAQEKGYGFLSTPAKYQRHLFNAMKEYELEVKKLSSGSNQIKVQEEFLKKQYLLYTLKGFLMDSSSIYARSAQEYVPVGLQSHIIGTSAVIEKAREIMYQGGIEKAYGVKGSSKHDQLIKRLAEESDFTDVIVSEDVFKTLSRTTLLLANPLDCNTMVPRISFST